MRKNHRSTKHRERDQSDFDDLRNLRDRARSLNLEVLHTPTLAAYIK